MDTSIILPCFSILLLFTRTLLLQLTIPILQYLARDNYGLLPFTHVRSLDQTAVSLCSAINLTTVRRHASDERVECVICLCDIDDGEEVRELRCEHLFHRACLDRWLSRARATCPLCRSLVVACHEVKMNVEEEEEHEGLPATLVAYVHSARWLW